MRRHLWRPGAHPWVWAPRNTVRATSSATGAEVGRGRSTLIGAPAPGRVQAASANDWPWAAVVDEPALAPSEPVGRTGFAPPKEAPRRAPATLAAPARPGGGSGCGGRDPHRLDQGDVLLAGLPGRGVDDDVLRVAEHTGQPGHRDRHPGLLADLAHCGRSGGLGFQQRRARHDALELVGSTPVPQPPPVRCHPCWTWWSNWRVSRR